MPRFRKPCSVHVKANSLYGFEWLNRICAQLLQYVPVISRSRMGYTPHFVRYGSRVPCGSRRLMRDFVDCHGALREQWSQQNVESQLEACQAFEARWDL